MSTQIKLDNLYKKYGTGAKATEVLRDINLTIEPGELFFLLGPSGCGKTTLLRIIAGLIEPTDGRVFFNDKDITTTPVEKRDTAMVFQNYALWPHMTVTQNVEFGPKMQNVDPKRQKQLGLEKLTLVEMETYGHRKPNQLSGGQQQRVALARALAAEPACLLLDEPLSNLDARLRAQMRTELRQLIKASGTTAIYVTHDQKEALSMADRIAILHNGSIIQVGPPEHIYNEPANTFAADFVGETNFVEGEILDNKHPIQIKTPVGILFSYSTKPFTPGQKVTCSVRPERISYGNKPERDISYIQSKIEYVVYFGESCQIGLKLPNQTVWKMTTLQKPDMPPLETVTLAIHPADVVILPEKHNF